MFTGLIQNQGEVLSLFGKKIRIVTALAPNLKIGDSVCVNGVCLTATAIEKTFFEAELSDETLSKTTLSTLKAGTMVNLELPVTASQGLGGHIVQGHVDCTSSILTIEPAGEAYQIRVRLPDLLKAYVVEKGSVAIDGVSLTVNSVDAESFSVMIIPHTWSHTIIKNYRTGQLVNIEVDIFAKYIQKAFASFSKFGATPIEGLNPQ